MASVLIGRTRLSEALRSVRASRERWRRGAGRTPWRPPRPYLWRKSIYRWGCCRASISVRVSHRVGSGRRHGRSALWRCGPDVTKKARQRKSVARCRRRGTRAVVVGGLAMRSGGASIRAGAGAWVWRGMQGVLLIMFLSSTVHGGRRALRSRRCDRASAHGGGPVLSRV